jgi:hypothetical protein
MTLREAAQQALEALYFKNILNMCGRFSVVDPIKAAEAAIALRAALAEPERKPLTDEEIDELPLPPSGTATVRDIVRLIERAHGIGGEA